MPTVYNKKAGVINIRDRINDKNRMLQEAVFEALNCAAETAAGYPGGIQEVPSAERENIIQQGTEKYQKHDMILRCFPPETPETIVYLPGYLCRKTGRLLYCGSGI